MVKTKGAHARLKAFLRRLVRLDASRGRIEDMVWSEFSASLRTLLDNPYCQRARPQRPLP